MKQAGLVGAGAVIFRNGFRRGAFGHSGSPIHRLAVPLPWRSKEIRDLPCRSVEVGKFALPYFDALPTHF